ncbi:hypothetical protein L208DRAFT_1396764 [Tricholoma matsutake]|nr:hypothetical protein L208DRAFT_1396764 [Tricholoma matsutake 945]
MSFIAYRGSSRRYRWKCKGYRWNVKDILQRLTSGTIDRLRHEMTSYKTRHSSYGDPSGCMLGTRIQILADLDAWASGEGCRNGWNRKVDGLTNALREPGQEKHAILLLSCIR